MNVSGEKKHVVARSGIDYVVVTFYNYFSPPIATPVHTISDYKYTKQYDMSGLRHRKDGVVGSMYLPTDEKEKIV
jgi:hypothetical protein